jgi:hypothetical protein
VSLPLNLEQCRVNRAGHERLLVLSTLLPFSLH